MQWFYFRVSNTRSVRPYRFNIINMLKPVSLYGKGQRPLCYSNKGASCKEAPTGWYRVGSHISYFSNDKVIPGLRKWLQVSYTLCKRPRARKVAEMEGEVVLEEDRDSVKCSLSQTPSFFPLCPLSSVVCLCVCVCVCVILCVCVRLFVNETASQVYLRVFSQLVHSLSLSVSLCLFVLVLLINNDKYQDNIYM